jgi:hypothetical protein
VAIRTTDLSAGLHSTCDHRRSTIFAANVRFPVKHSTRPVLRLFCVALLAACSDDGDSGSSCAYAVTQALDAGFFDSALEHLDSRACEAEMSAEQREIDRAAAYIGKAGYDVADLLLIVLQADSDSDGPDADLRLFQALGGLGASGGGLRNLGHATRAYERMVDAFSGRLDEACLEANVTLLSRLQKDACFLSGLLSYARLTRGFDLLLRNQLEALLGLQPLDCANDSNFSGVPDEGEIAACALRARDRLDEGGGLCRAAGMHDGQVRGAIRWDRVAGVPELAFFEGGIQFATLVPVRVTVEPGGPCTAGTEGIRLLQPVQDAGTQLVVTDGLCEVEVTHVCNALDTDAGCWPCPIPRGGGLPGAMSVTDALLNPVNFEAEHWLAVLSGDDSENVGAELEELREKLCEPARDSSAECEEVDGSPRLTLDALREYLRQ